MVTPDRRGLPIANIVIGHRLRPLNEAKVENLMVSMAENGFIGSIQTRLPMNEADDGLFFLVAGRHRIEAWGRLGNLYIPATSRFLTDDEALQIEIDENLLSPELNPLERAEMVAARFAIWARRFPDRVVEEDGTLQPKRGRPKNSDKLSQFRAGAPEAMGFAAGTAAEVGLTARSIERAWATVTGLPADLRARLHGTHIAKNDGLLRQLAALGDREEQAQVADVLIAGKTKSVSDARAIAAGNLPVRPAETPVDETLKAFRAIWGKASPSARTAILDDLAGRKLPGGFRVICEASHG